MNEVNPDKAFKNVMGLGDIDYEFNLELSEKEALSYKFDLNQANSIHDCKSLLLKTSVKNKILISSKNNLINLLLFINKTNTSKSFTEFLSINCLFLNQEFAFIKEKIKNEFDENFLYLIESNIISPCKFKLNIKIENKEPKTFESELTETSMVLEDSKNDKIGLDQKKPNEIGKKVDDLFAKQSDDKNKPDDSKKVVDPTAKKTVETKNLEEKSKSDPKEDKKSKKQPKAGNIRQNFDKILLPNVSKPDYSEKEILDVEGNDGHAHNLLNKIVYDFKNCDYLFIDLNKFLNFTEITLFNLFDFLKEKIIKEYFKTKIIMFFPGIFNNFNKDDLHPLIDLISLADIVIFDKRDALKVTKLLGYDTEQKNFEVRFMYLNELKRGKFKAERTAIFLDDFSKLTIVTQETQKNLISSTSGPV